MRLVRNGYLSVLLVLALGMVSRVSAQNLYLGLKGGLNLATTDAKLSNGASREASAGEHYGLVFQAEANDFLGFQTELAFTRKGDYIQYSQGRYQAKLGYYQLPLLVKLHQNFGNIQAYALVGPYLAYLNKAVERTPSSGDRDGKLQLPGFRRWDMGWVGGLGASYPWRKGRFIAEVRYELGQANINNTYIRPGQSPENFAAYNRNIALSLGYLWTLGGGE